jgi:transcriptional regulator GlxA family with amidase domain
MKKILLVGIIALLIIGYVSYDPIREFSRIPVYTGDTAGYSASTHDTSKKNIYLVAYNKGTEIFDLIAPFYLFNLTGQANVYIVAPDNTPVCLMKGFFLLPHYSFKQIDSLNWRADAVVIPNLSAMDKEQPDSTIVQWIKKQVTNSTKLLAVCAGSYTAAATKLYDGKTFTTHASEMKQNKKLFPEPAWIDGVSYTKVEGLYSTAGVSNATEGSLAVIKDLFGEAIMQSVMDSIHYPYSFLKTEHASIPVQTRNKVAILKKVFLNKDKHIGVLLASKIDEFKLAAVLDAYHRTFPATIKTFTLNSSYVISRFGLTILPSGRESERENLDEIHAVELPQKKALELFPFVPLISYAHNDGRYIFDQCLDRIDKKYGHDIYIATKRLLDYN